ncbi:hypothetical protein GLW00_06580 [Halobacillus litoralis]|uniref:Branched-chain amino acid ABC transporter substrate-binding protein n=1 Tax=Halobacillus litoralis TaxID=45668 RepID=A0A845FA24_9BACI|nr:hypothetical protein [Halobacillus litoralis]MYL70505.1 hypothetical protein [Halobacillus litoralis]
MQKIKDERLQLKNLKNIRVVFIIQTLGILALLGYDLFTKGLDGMTDNPLWFVFMISVIVNAYLSMSISVDHEKAPKSPLKGLYVSLSIVGVLSVIVGMLVSFSEGQTIWNGLLIGGIIFISFLVPVLYIYKLRKDSWDEEMSE